MVTPAGVVEQDLFVDAGQIVEGESAAREQIDARGLLVLPGLIDSHLHFNEPGRTEWEGIASGSAALAAGGGTCFFDMPLNSAPPTLDGPSFDLKLAAARTASVTDFGLWGGLTPQNLDDMEELAARGRGRVALARSARGPHCVCGIRPLARPCDSKAVGRFFRQLGRHRGRAVDACGFDEP